MTIAILRIGHGNFDSIGFPVTLQIDNQIQKNIILPPNPELLTALENYRESYHTWGINYRLGDFRGIQVSDDMITNIKDEIATNFENLETQFNNWLNHHHFNAIRNNLIANAHQIDKIFIEVEDIKLQMLPWNKLNDLDIALVNIEVLMSKPIAGGADLNLIHPLEILVILAIRNQIDPDLIKTHFADAKITILQEPSYDEIYDTVNRLQKLDIIFFAGHSYTTTTFDDARIYIQPNTYRTIDELQEVLKMATEEKNLKLAVFNSCDGLGIVRRLDILDIQIPYLIVMREPVHNQVAQKFLLRLLENFSQGRSLDRAVKRTKGFLRGIHQEYPNAAWLPLLFVNPNEPPLYYPETFLDKLIKKIKSLIKKFKLHLVIFGLLSLIVALILPKIFFSNILACDLDNTQDLLSCGATSLMERNLQEDKRAGLEYFKKGDYKKAIHFLAKSFNSTQNPETLLFLNNAQVLKEFKEKKLNKNNIFPLAVVIPVQDNTSLTSSNYITSKYILQGVAFAQKQFNENLNNENKLLFVIANDKNDPADVPNSTGAKVAKELVKRKLYAVMGHYSSRVTFYNKDIYTKNKLVFMSSSSTASYLDSGEKLTFSKEENPYFFRVVSSTEKSAQKLANYLIENGVEKVNIFYAEQDLFSGSFGQRFKEYWEENKGKTIKVASLQYDIILSELFNQSSSEKDAIVLCPGAFTKIDSRDKEINNAIEIITNNNQNLPMVGCDVFTTQDYLKPIFNNQRNFIVSAHSFSENIPPEFKFNFEKLFNHEIEPNEELIRTILAYDATKVLGAALNFLSQQKTNFNSTDLQKHLLSEVNFQGISTEQISFQGSDPLKDTTRLIRPTEQLGKWQLVK